MTPKFNISIEQRVTYSRVFEFKDDDCSDISLAPYTFSAQIKTAIGGTVITTPTLAVSGNQLTLTLSSAQTGALATTTTGVWDLLATAGGTTEKWIYGDFVVNGTVTVP